MFHLSKICFFLIVISSTHAAPQTYSVQPEYSISTDEILEFCCRQGEKFGKNKLAATCKLADRYSATIPAGDLPNLDIPRSREPNVKKSCESSFEGCCSAELNYYACYEGTRHAQRGGTCTFSLKQFGHAYRSKMKDCCDACLSGKDTAYRKGDCLHKPGLDEDYDLTFRKCCNDETANMKAFPNVQRKRPASPVLRPANIIKTRTNKCGSNNFCHHICHEPEYPEFPVKCSCRSGYALSSDGHSCKDIDECMTGTHNCPKTHYCHNQPGDYTCLSMALPVYEGPSRRNGVESSSGFPYFQPLAQDGRCPTGYKPDLEDETRCIDMNECEEGYGDQTCAAEGKSCQNTWGKFVCIPIYREPADGRASSLIDMCAEGLRLSGGKCIDVDECLIGNHNCNLREEKCINKWGTYHCKPIEVIEVSSKCAEGFVSQEGYGCLPPYEVDGSACPNGFMWQTQTSRCMDIDECSFSNKCGPREKCVNTEGSYICESITCLADEYVTMNGCEKKCSPDEEWDSEDAVCKRKRKICPSGYKLNRDINQCEDIDECRSNPCSRDQICSNTPGSYECYCKTGYKPHESGGCSDIDECALPSTKCPENSNCVNIPGSYECECKGGFRKYPVNGVCIDINECSTPRHRCSSSQKCHNTIGSYHCECLPGYKKDASNPLNCIDVDECNEFISLTGASYLNLKNLTCQHQCHNTAGSFECSCPPGYLLDPSNNRTCIDQDECESNPCFDPQDICINTHGSYECFKIECPRGYTQEDNDFRCKRDSFDCDVNDPQGCVRKPSHYTFNYLTFPSNLKLLDDGRTQIFGISFGHPEAKVTYDYTVIPLTSQGNVPIVRKQYFTHELRNNDFLFYVKKPIIGPQTFEVKINVEIHHNGRLTATHVVRTIIIVSEYEF